MKKVYPDFRRGFAPIVIVPIISIVLILGLYASNKFLGIEYPWQPEFGYEQDLYRSAQTTPSPTSNTNETVYTDEGSANWKTYTDNKLHFQIKYPEDVRIRYEYPDGGVSFGKSTDPNSIGGDQLDILFRGNVGEDPKNVLATVECPQKIGEPPGCNENVEQVTINNAVGIRTLGPNYPGKYNYYLTNQAKTVPVLRLYYSPENEAQPIQTFVEMLSTFKFTE